MEEEEEETVARERATVQDLVGLYSVHEERICNFYLHTAI